MLWVTIIIPQMKPIFLPYQIVNIMTFIYQVYLLEIIVQIGHSVPYQHVADMHYMKHVHGIQITPTLLTLAVLGFIAAAAMSMVRMLVPSTATTALVIAAAAIRGVGFLWRDRAKRFALSD